MSDLWSLAPLTPSTWVENYITYCTRKPIQTRIGPNPTYFLCHYGKTIENYTLLSTDDKIILRSNYTWNSSCCFFSVISANVSFKLASLPSTSANSSRLAFKIFMVSARDSSASARRAFLGATTLNNKYHILHSHHHANLAINYEIRRESIGYFTKIISRSGQRQKWRYLSDSVIYFHGLHPLTQTFRRRGCCANFLWIKVWVWNVLLSDLAHDVHLQEEWNEILRQTVIPPCQRSVFFFITNVLFLIMFDISVSPRFMMDKPQVLEVVLRALQE